MRALQPETKTIALCRETRQLRVTRAGLTCSRNGDITWGGKTIHVSRDLANVLYRLMVARGVVTKGELADWLYSESLDGGPLPSRIRALMHRLRATLAHKGFPVVIKTRHSIGYEFRPDLMPAPAAYSGRAREPYTDNLEAFA